MSSLGAPVGCPPVRRSSGETDRPGAPGQTSAASGTPNRFAVGATLIGLRARGDRCCIADAVTTAVSENSLNVHNIEAAVKKVLLPQLFSLIGLDGAKRVIEQIINIARVGLSRGGGL